MKLTKLLFLTLAAASLSGCAFGGGGDEEVDPTLYELKITTNLEEAKDKIKAEFVGERDEEEIEELKKAGAAQEDIDKAGTCVDGTYYFFDQDPINLYEPFIPGYEFLGWFEDGKFLGYLDTDYDGTPNYIWNMENKNTTLEARFKLMKFEILYMDEGTTQVDPKGNPKTWSILDGEVELKHEDKEAQGLKFEGWTFAMGGDTRYDGYVTKLNEQFLIDSNIAKQSLEGRETMTFWLHENYSVIEDSFKLTYMEAAIDNVYVSIKEPGENTFQDLVEGHWVTGGQVSATLPRGTQIKVHATAIDWEEYEIDGVYCGGEKISEKLSNDEYGFTLSGNTDCEIRIKSIA